MRKASSCAPRRRQGSFVTALAVGGANDSAAVSSATRQPFETSCGVTICTSGGLNWKRCPPPTFCTPFVFLPHSVVQTTASTARPAHTDHLLGEATLLSLRTRGSASLPLAVGEKRQECRFPEIAAFVKRQECRFPEMAETSNTMNYAARTTPNSGAKTFCRISGMTLTRNAMHHLMIMKSESGRTRTVSVSPESASPRPVRRSMFHVLR